MSKVKVERATAETLDKLDIESWGEWECDVSRFDWEYDQTETCYLYQGKVKVTCEDQDAVEFGAGDIVVFPKGLKCTWDVTAPVRKRYKFD
jgi:uncharacterized cupin superfamily protein